ncbi:hypothetical protein [Treponema sp. R8-4-B8]
MKLKLLTACICLCAFFRFPLFAQNHNSISLENQVYYILEQAEIKGLCKPLSGIKPYTRSIVITAIEEILNSQKAEKLRKHEIEILEQYLAVFSKPKNGMDWRRGAWHGETEIGKDDIELSANIGVSADIEGSAGFYYDDQYNGNYGTDTWIQVYLNGDFGSHVSYNLSFEGGLIIVPRESLGKYHTYYENFNDGKDLTEYKDEEIDVYSEPLTHFPYSYKKRWDGSVHHLNAMYDFDSWPETASIAYNYKPELTSSFLDDKIIMRLGRLSHEWGSTPFGSSLALNQMSRPFIAIEGEFRPFSWLTFSSMTGFLEFFNSKGEKASGMTFQNAYSITMLQLRYKNYLYFDLGETVVWPKRFELGYVFPLMSNVIYKGFIGDFDNLGVFINIKAQYPGIGNIWFSFFGDEARFESNMGELDRSMFAWQAGANFSLPFLSFTSIKFSYTKVNPYCYTHNRNLNPWYSDLRMETAYVNNGVCLGYYLPPNSDEILVRFQTMPGKNVTAHLQYQMIRHGADFGPNAVDGSNLLSELDPYDRDNTPALKRFFLQDGAYQWSHIIKIGVEWNLSKLPVAFYGEAGTVISYFTDILEGSANDGAAHPNSIVDTSDYPKSTGFIVTIGFKIYPR